MMSLLLLAGRTVADEILELIVLLSNKGSAESAQMCRFFGADLHRGLASPTHKVGK